MSTATPAAAPASPARPGFDLFLISLLILFLELACIRWFPAHVLFLTFFTNTMLLACFLGMSVGCLAAGHPRNYLTWTPALLGLAILAAFGIEGLMALNISMIDVGNQASPQLVFFGTEYHVGDVARFVIPIEVIGGFFFLVIALALVGPGQELGRAFNRMPDRVLAYTINIAGSVVGIALFALFSYLHLSPFWWFVPVALGLGYYLVPRPLSSQPLWSWLPRVALLAVIVLAAGSHSGRIGPLGQAWAPEWMLRLIGRWREDGPKREFYWSPYYRIDYSPGNHLISVNLIGHQQMVARNDSHYWGFGYPLPHALNRASRGRDFTGFKDVLIIGAGSGNDISRALQWGAESVDAVEIDPVIPALGKRDHPDKPYDDPRVRLILDDGRNFLRSSTKQYDLIVYALVDSLVLQSSYSNIRLESYLFTKQAFEDVKKHLKPDGQFVMYNYFRQGWIVARLSRTLEEVFGKDNPVVLTLPYRDTIEPDEFFSGFTLFFAGNTTSLKEAFAKEPKYWLRNDRPPSPTDPNTPNGFQEKPLKKDQVDWIDFGPAEVKQPEDSLRIATDDWPFLYLRQPMVAFLTLRGIAVMGGIALVLIFLFLPRTEGSRNRWAFDGRMFFLGAGFMLVETKAVVHMALLFGSTWMVNSVVFFAVLVMILLANLFVLKYRPRALWPYYVGLIVTLGLNAVVPLDYFLGLDRTLQIVSSCLLVFAPILFAGVIFAVSFGRTAEPDRAFGANIAGAMFGGLAENTSMLLGFQYLILVAVGLYLLSAVFGRRPEGPVAG